MRQLQATVLQDYQHFIKAKETAALRENNMFWQKYSKEKQEYNPFSHTNLEIAISKVPNYIKCVQQCAEKWIGYHFHFPILWMPTKEYHAHHRLAKKDEATVRQKLKNVQGFRASTDSTYYSYYISNLHAKIQYPDSDSD